MRRFWIGVFLLGVICAVGIAMLCFSSRFYQEFSDTLNDAKAFAADENWDAAAEKVRAADALWHRYRRFLAASSDHEPVEQIERLLSQLSLYEKNRLRVDFIDICQSLSLLCEAIDESHNLKWWSIL